MNTISIENDALSVTVAADFGGRVVSLCDKRAGHEWMAQGGESATTGEDAVYLGDEAAGWDECFPTVGRWDAGATPWHRVLRDHGDLWGRPWAVDAQTDTAVTLSYADPQFRFTRTLSLEGGGLAADYAVDNLSREPLPYLWALHALLVATPGDRIELPGDGQVRVAYLGLKGETLRLPAVGWTHSRPVLPFDLADVQPPEVQFAAKLHVSGVPGAKARIGRPGRWLEIGWDRNIADLGIWLTYGAWFGHQEAALEPTSASADHLGQAIEAGAAPLMPSERRAWRVTLACTE